MCPHRIDSDLEIMKMKATHNISAVYFPKDSIIELTWEEVTTGNTATLTTYADKSVGTAIAEVVSPCVYHQAAVKTLEEESK